MQRAYNSLTLYMDHQLAVQEAWLQAVHITFLVSDLLPVVISTFRLSLTSPCKLASSEQTATKAKQKRSREVNSNSVETKKSVETRIPNECFIALGACTRQKFIRNVSYHYGCNNIFQNIFAEILFLRSSHIISLYYIYLYRVALPTKYPHHIDATLHCFLVIAVFFVVAGQVLIWFLFFLGSSGHEHW